MAGTRLDVEAAASVAEPNATLHVTPGGHFLAHLCDRDIFDCLRR
jgi:hypothetical protein